MQSSLLDSASSKLGHLLPAEKDQKRLHDIESTLLRRRTTGRVAGVIAATTASLQVVRLIAEGGYVEKLRHIEIDPASGTVLRVTFVAMLLYFLLRRTGVLLQESREPFHYTFWIEPFVHVDKTPGDRVATASWERWALLHHDLTERLDQRIKRFAIISDLRSEKSGVSEGSRISDRRVRSSAAEPASIAK